MTDSAASLIEGVRMHQSALVRLRVEAQGHQEARDGLIRELRESDSERWSYARIAEATGLTSVNVVKILRKSASTL